MGLSVSDKLKKYITENGGDPSGAQTIAELVDKLPASGGSGAKPIVFTCSGEPNQYGAYSDVSCNYTKAEIRNLAVGQVAGDPLPTVVMIPNGHNYVATDVELEVEVDPENETDYVAVYAKVILYIEKESSNLVYYQLSATYTANAEGDDSISMSERKNTIPL